MKLPIPVIFIFLPLALLAQNPDYLDISSAASIKNTGWNYGVSISDYNLDGWDDIFVCRLDGANLLYRNKGDNTFRDYAIPARVAYAGPSTTAVWADLDNDGDPDLYVGNMGANDVLYQNLGNGFFEDITLAAGIENIEQPRAILAEDVDRDGYLDIYVANINAENILWRNNGNMTFTDVTAQAGAGDDQISMGAVFFDYDNDNDPDLYLTHDAGIANILLENDGSGNFTDVSTQAGVDYKGQGMGVDFADFNGDGFFDLYITNLYDNVLFLNNGDGTFTDHTSAAQVGDPGMGWGITCLDYNNDGWPDIYVCNDYYFLPSAYPNRMYRNNGDSTFSNVAAGTPLQSPYEGYGTACLDVNRDGRLDLFIANNRNDGNQLLLNQTVSSNNWLTVKTRGTVSNRNGIGARVTVQCGDKIWVEMVNAGCGYASQNALALHFGLGSSASIEELKVEWPSGLVDAYHDVKPNTIITVIEQEGFLTSTEPVATTSGNTLEVQNPALGGAEIFFFLEKAGLLELSAWDISGKEIEVLEKGYFHKGSFRTTWNYNEKGIYFLQLRMEDSPPLTKKLIIQ